MEAVGREGRTVLFVCHNMAAVRQLCERAILLEEGRIRCDAPAAEAVRLYGAAGFSRAGAGELDCAVSDPFSYRSDALRFLRLRLLGGQDGAVRAQFAADEPIRVEIVYRVARQLRGARFNLGLSTLDGELVFLATDLGSRPESLPPGVHRSVATIPGDLLNARDYAISVGCDIPGVEVVAPRRECLRFCVAGVGNQGGVYAELWPGVVRPGIAWVCQPQSPEVNDEPGAEP